MRRAGPIFAVVLVGLACGGLPPSRKVDDDCRCSVEHPFGWRDGAGELWEDPALELMRPIREEYVVVERIPKLRYEEPVSAEAVLDWSMSGRAQWDPAVPPDFERIGGLPAVHREVFLPSDGTDQDTVFWSVVIEGPDAFHRVLAWTLQERRDRSLPEVQQVVRTFRTEGEPIEGDVYSLPAIPDPDPEPLLVARRAFGPLAGAEVPREAGTPALPSDGAELVKYRSAVGDLWATLSPDPGDGQRHPAVLWAHAGFGGMGPPSEAVQALRDAGLVVMAPSFRGEYDNPGRFELFGGEVDDLLAARDHLAALPWVDPDRITLVGHGTGATLALLAAATGDEGLRAVVAMEGAPDLVRASEVDADLWGNTPYEAVREHELRSALWFAPHIRRPTFVVEAEYSVFSTDGPRMERAAAGAPVTSLMIARSDSFAYVEPLVRHLAGAIAADTGEDVDLGLDAETLHAVGSEAWRSRWDDLGPDLSAFAAEELAAGFRTSDEVVQLTLDTFAGDWALAPLRVAAREAVRERGEALRADETTWPETTDVDRVVGAMEDLARRGVVAELHLEDCEECARSVLRDRLASGGTGYVFASEPDVRAAVRTGSLWLYFGDAVDDWSPEGAAAVGRAAVEVLRGRGLEPVWSGDPSIRIEVPVTWQRRGPWLTSAHAR